MDDDVVVNGCGSGCVVGDCGSVEEEGEGSAVGVAVGLGSEDGAVVDVGAGVAVCEGEDSGAGVGLGSDELEVVGLGDGVAAASGDVLEVGVGEVAGAGS